MAESGSSREARRRPEMDLLVGPIEAAGHPADRTLDPEAPSPEPSDGSEEPTWRTDG